MRLEAKDIVFSYGQTSVLKNVSFVADKGQLISILGPNGVGKSTLFGCLLGFLKPQKGEIRINDKKIEDYSRKELSRVIAYIPQSYVPAFNHTVLDCVLMGLSGSLNPFQIPSEDDVDKAMESLESLGISRLAKRGCLQISGGERQLMLLARARVQNAHTLIMDEPTANLDFGNSYRVMQKISSLRNKGYTIVLSTHEPDQAIRFSDRIIAMHGGSILADGKPDEVMTSENLRILYGIDVAVNDVKAGEETYKVCVPVI